MGKKSLTIVVPVYNEEASLPAVVAAINAALDCSILAVDDGSTDNSLAILKSLQRRYKNLTIASKRKNEGFGGAWKTGIFSSMTPYIAFIDADLTYHPKYIPVLLDTLEKYNLDCAWTNRFGGALNNMPFLRKIGNKILAFTFFLVTGVYIPDITSGQRIFQRTSLMKLDPKTLPNGLNLVSAISKRVVSRKLNYKVIPCDYNERGGSSKLHIVTDFLKMMADIFFER